MQMQKLVPSQLLKISALLAEKLLLAQLVIQVPKDHLEMLVHLDKLELPEMEVVKAHLDLLALLEIMEILVPQVPLAPLVLSMMSLVFKAPLDLLALLVNPDNQVNLAAMAILAPLEHLAHKVMLDQMVPQVKMVKLEIMALMVNKEMVEIALIVPFHVPHQAIKKLYPISSKTKTKFLIKCHISV